MIGSTVCVGRGCIVELGEILLKLSNLIIDRVGGGGRSGLVSVIQITETESG